MKTCDYCGSEVPDETVSCPHCAAHFDISTLPRPPVPEEPPVPADSPLLAVLRARLGISYRGIGKLAVALIAVYFFFMFMGVLGTISFWLVLAALLLAAAVLILKRVGL